MPANSNARSSFRQAESDRLRKRRLPPGWTAENSARLDSHVAAILAELRPDKPVIEEAGGTLHSGSINVYDDGHWHRYSARTHGPDALALVAELLGEEGGHAYALRFLAAHPGRGKWEATDSAAGRVRAARNAELAAYMLGKRVPIADTAAATYLTEERAVPVCAALAEQNGVLGYLADARPQLGHGAIVGVLTDSADPTAAIGVQLGYLEPRGAHIRDAKGKRDRRVFYAALDPEARQRACFRIWPVTTEAGVAPVDATLVTEGLENSLSLAGACPGTAVLGLPGIGKLGTLAVSGPVIVVRDNDGGPDAPATKALAKGLDALLLGGADVRVTDTPLGRDAADYAKDGQLAELRQLVLSAKPAKLSRDGELERLARLGWEDYQSERRAAARALGWTVSALDSAVVARRPFEEWDSPGEDSFTGALGSDDAHAEPIGDIAAVCDAALAQLKKYLIASHDDLCAAVMWALHAHFVHHATIVLDISPRLLFEAKGAECGKTTAMEAVSCLTPRYLRVSRISAAAFASVVDSYRVTLFIDELDKLIRQRQQTDLHAILLTGHRRHEAYRPLRVPAPDGRGWIDHLQRTWLTYGGTAIAGQVIEDQTRSRFIVVRLPRATQEEAKRLVHLKRGTCPVLDEARRAFARWAADKRELPEAKLPEALFNRAGDNWEPLLQIARAVGGHWPETIERAALKALNTPRDEDNLPKAFLDDLRRLLLPEGREPLSHMWTKDITLRLKALDDPAADWSRAYKGTEITDYWTGTMLHHWLGPDDGPKSIRHDNQQFRGVYTYQLRDVFERHPKNGNTYAPVHISPVPSVPPIPSGKDVDQDSGKSGTEENFNPSQKGGNPSQAARIPSHGAGTEGLGRVDPIWDGLKFEPVPPQYTDNIEEISRGTDGTDGTGEKWSGGIVSPKSAPPHPTDKQPKVAHSKAPRKPRSKLNGGTPPTDPDDELFDKRLKLLRKATLKSANRSLAGERAKLAKVKAEAEARAKLPEDGGPL